MSGWRSLATVAVAGVVVAHAFDFVVVYGAASEREHQLRATGHEYWPVAVIVAVLAAVVAVGCAAGRGGSRGLRAGARAGGSRSVSGDVARLAVAQVGLFTVVEMLERIGAGVAPATLVRAPEFVVGLLLQVVVAAVAVVLLAMVERLSERAVRAAARPRRRRVADPRRRPAGVPDRPAVAFVSTARPRAPPSAALA